MEDEQRKVIGLFCATDEAFDTGQNGSLQIIHAAVGVSCDSFEQSFQPKSLPFRVLRVGDAVRKIRRVSPELRAAEEILNSASSNMPTGKDSPSKEVST